MAKSDKKRGPEPSQAEEDLVEEPAETVDRQTVTVNVRGGPYVYNGHAHGAEAWATDRDGNILKGKFAFTYERNGVETEKPPVDAGSYLVIVRFSLDDDADLMVEPGRFELIIKKATPVVTVSGGPFTYNGSLQAVAASATGVGGAQVKGAFTYAYALQPGGATVAKPTNAGTYAVTASFASADANYCNATGTGTLTINQAVPTVTVTGGPFTYNGSVQAVTASATGVGGASVSGAASTLTYAPQPGGATVAAPTNAGTYAVTANFTSADANYCNATGTGTLTINPAIPTVAVTGGPFTYNGSAQAVTASATGVGGASVSGAASTLTYALQPGGATVAAPTNAGTYAVTASFTSADANYSNATGTGTLTINQAIPTVVVTGGAFTYNANAQAAAASATGVTGASVSGASTFTYALQPGGATVAAPTNAGTYAVTASFTSADANYSNAPGTGTLTINQAIPTVTVTGGAFTYNGKPQHATVTVTGLGGANIAGQLDDTMYTNAQDGSTVKNAVNAGVYLATANFTSSDPNYANAPGVAMMTISLRPSGLAAPIDPQKALFFDVYAKAEAAKSSFQQDRAFAYVFEELSRISTTAKNCSGASGRPAADAQKALIYSARSIKANLAACPDKLPLLSSVFDSIVTLNLSYPEQSATLLAYRKIGNYLANAQRAFIDLQGELEAADYVGNGAGEIGESVDNIRTSIANESALIKAMTLQPCSASDPGTIPALQKAHANTEDLCSEAICVVQSWQPLGQPEAVDCVQNLMNEAVYRVRLAGIDISRIERSSADPCQQIEQEITAIKRDAGELAQLVESHDSQSCGKPAQYFRVRVEAIGALILQAKGLCAQNLKQSGSAAQQTLGRLVGEMGAIMDDLLSCNADAPAGMRTPVLKISSSLFQITSYLRNAAAAKTPAPGKTVIHHDPASPRPNEKRPPAGDGEYHVFDVTDAPRGANVSLRVLGPSEEVLDVVEDVQHGLIRYPVTQGDVVFELLSNGVLVERIPYRSSVLG